MINLVIVVSLLIGLSFLCSLLESVILSIRRPFIQTLIDGDKKSGRLLKKMKDNIDEPIAAILTLNTISHTMGAAVSGAIAAELFGSKWMGVFSAVLTLLILVLSEIIPKTLGARYWKSLSHLSAYILRVMIIILKPLILPMNYLSRLITNEDHGDRVSKAELFNYIKIGYDQGVIDPDEFKIIENLLKLRNIRVRDIMTPRTVVESIEPGLKINDLREKIQGLKFSRIPIYDSRKNRIHGFVLRREIMDYINKNKSGKSLSSISTKPVFLPDSLSILELMNFFAGKGIHMAFVINEYGDYTGLVTIEDAVETLLGVEIVDEYDPVTDMQALAYKKMALNLRGKNRPDK